ncbi:MAG: DUF47 domain-containing protein [Nitriliruptorales bacterium]
MRWPLPRMLENLTRAGEKRFVELLVAQIDATIEGAELARAVVGGRRVDTGFRERMREVEHAGDDERAELVRALSTALVTPIDREDLFRLSRGIDDVLDHLRDFAIEWELYGMSRGELFTSPLEAVIEGMSTLRSVAADIVEHPSLVADGALGAKRTGNRIRRSYQQAMADLYSVGDDQLTIDVLKQRELLRRLDIVGLRIRQAADILADASVKRSH